MKNIGEKLLKKSKTSGITLIALVVTIIVLIILATVSINVVFGEGGLIKRAEQARETHTEAQAREKLELKLGEYKFDIYEQNIKDGTLKDSYLCTKLSELGPTRVATDTKYYEVVVDEYVFWVNRETLEIVSKGKDNTPDATKVTASNITIKEGQTASIAVTIEPTGASTRNVTYKSSNENVAKVSNGTVTGISAGKATITIKTKNGHEETFEVTVIESNLTKITLNPTTLNFVVGDTASKKISATLEPADAMNRKITWTSTNTKVATVNDKGEVTAVGKGTCEVKATSEKNANVFGSCSVTVSEIEVESISLDKQTLKVGPGKTSEALKVTFTPANATNKTITWKSNTTTVATVSDGKVTGIKEGTATITATSANGKTATCNVTIAEVGMTIAEAKAAVQRDGLQAHIGDLVEYNPTAGGKWRIFYYDEAGEFGTAGKLYLKRDFVSNDTKLSNYTSYTPSTQGLEIMKAMNPKWRDYPTAGSNTIDLENEHCVVWLCDPKNWTKYKTEEADYTIGSPSVEMYMKAFNVWKTGNKDATNLVCKVESANGYSVGANGTYYNSGYYTKNNTIEAGPNNIFMTAGGSDYWWLASTSSNGLVLLVGGNEACVVYNYPSYTRGICPIVSLK